MSSDVESKFHFSREMVSGEIYRKYEKAMRKHWKVEDLDFTQDALDWQRITPEQQKVMIDAVVKGTQTQQWKDTLARNEWAPFLQTGAEFGSYVESESKRLGGILRDLGLAK